MEKLTGFERFGRAIQKSLQFFQKKPQSEGQLAGRIQELSRSAKEVFAELVMIREELKTEVDPTLFNHIEAVIDPLIRDINRIQKAISGESNPALQVQIFKKYTVWIEKANLWIRIKNQNNDKAMIEKAVIRHIMEDFFERIERDLQVINDYQQHMLENLPLDEEERGRLWMELENKIGPYIRSLLTLKRPTFNLAIDRLAQWKQNVDRRREKYFDGALFTIDNLVQSYSPGAEETNEHEHLVDIFSRMAALEEQIPEIINEINELDKEDEFQRDICEQRLDTLEDESNQINLDLRLTPELIDRLQVVMDALTGIRMRLNNYS